MLASLKLHIVLTTHFAYFFLCGPSKYRVISEVDLHKKKSTKQSMLLPTFLLLTLVGSYAAASAGAENVTDADADVVLSAYERYQQSGRPPEQKQAKCVT